MSLAVFVLLSDNHATTCLVSGQYQHLGNLYVCRCVGGIHSHIGYIVASKGLDSFIHVSGTFTCVGAKKTPFYRVVVADSRYPRDGRFIEEIGTYNPLVEPSEFKIDADKAKKWIANGAQPTDTVKALMKKNNII